MNSKQRKALAIVFTDPVSSTIEWSAIENLLLAAGRGIIEGGGSRVHFEKDGEIESFHRPHLLPRKRNAIRCALPASS